MAQTAQANFRTSGVRVVPYPSDMRAFAPDAQLAAIVHRWGGFYTRVAESVLDGTLEGRAGVGRHRQRHGRLDAVDPALPKRVARRRAGRRAAIVAGTLKPFAAPLRDNAGVVRLASGSLADAQIKAMDWFVEGVVGTVPKAR